MGLTECPPEGTDEAFPSGVGDGLQGTTVGSFVLQAKGKNGPIRSNGRFEKSGPKGEEAFSAGCGAFRKYGDTLFVFQGSPYLFEDIPK